MSSEIRKPTVYDHPRLAEWLCDRHDARHLWTAVSEQFGKDRGSIVEAWRIGASVVYVLLSPPSKHSPKGGFDLLTGLNDLSIDKTFVDAEKRLGLKIEEDR